MDKLYFIGLLLAFKVTVQVASVDPTSPPTSDAFCVDTPRGRECFKLHHSSLGVNWSQAIAECTKGETFLSVVLDATVQASLRAKFVQGFTVGNTNAWIGGQETGDATWFWTDGSPFKAALNRNGNGDRCGFALVKPKRLPKIESRWCQNSTTNLICRDNGLTPCQNSSTTTGTPFVVNSKNYCYYKTNEKSTWYEAKQFCHWREAELASFGIYNDSHRFREEYWVNLTHLLTTTGTWVGLHRTRWTWATSVGLYPQVYMEPAKVAYTSWIDEQSNRNDQKCLYVDLLNNANWADECCHRRLNYYICQNTTGITTQEMPEEFRHENIIIIVAVGSAVAILVIIILILFIMIRRRSRREAEATSGPESTEPENDTLPSAHAEYRNMAFGTPSSVNPADQDYAEINTSQDNAGKAEGFSQVLDPSVDPRSNIMPPLVADESHSSSDVQGPPGTINDSQSGNGAKIVPHYKVAPGSGDLYTEVVKGDGVTDELELHDNDLYISAP